MWTAYQDLDTDLPGLVAAVATVLATLDVDVEDDRVRGVPTARVLRYYQSTGLLDRPLRYDGRRAIYGFRHLVQAVAVKVLQSEGLSLDQVQQALAGRETAALAGLIAQAAGVLGAASSAPSPAQVAPQSGSGSGPSGVPVAPVSAPPASRSSSPEVRSVLQVELSPGVVVTLDPTRVADPSATLAALAAALPPRGVE